MRVAWVRTIAAAFWIVTAVYCLLSAIPFASEQFLKPGLSPALVLFAAWHRYLSAAALAAVAAGLAPWLRSRDRRVMAFAGTWAVAAVVLFVVPPVSQLQPSPTALSLALLSLLPAVWIALLDVDHAPASARFEEDRDASRDFVACMAAALGVAVVHAVAPAMLVGPSGWTAIGLGFVRSLLLHMVAFSAIFAVISVVKGASRAIADRDDVEAWIARAVLAAALAAFLVTIVLRPLSLTGTRGVLVAIVFGAALAMTLGPRGTRARAGFEEALGGLVPAWAGRSPMTAIAWCVIVAGAVVFVERQAAVEDWNFLIAKSTAFGSWLLALAVSLRVVRLRAWRSEVLPFIGCLAILGLNVAASRGPERFRAAADAWKARDPSARLIADALTPAVSVLDEGLETLLQRHTNIPHSTSVQPVTIDLAPLTGPPSAVRPHIFLFVVDSLRRDYLSVYNHDVTFTPAVDRFARESTVFDRAFTRYGATGLSVPSIWVGGLVLHKQYVTPFPPMNTLAKLLEHEQYRQWIGMDNILDVILPPSTRREPLDAGIQVADYRFCRTLDEVRGRLDRLQDGEPTFVYSLPQDIHISAITREGAKPVDAGSYGSFYAPYASRLRRLDQCFGRFIDDLKSRGLFDKSVVILTADHGDSLGEQGRMGHAYTIFPEIVQVPLIVHLPTDMAARLRADTSAPAYTIDLTPTLYALLGHSPQPPAPFFGRPLFRDGASPAAPRATEPQMVASSYGSVYGTLMDDSRRLYIFDAIALREYAYDFDGTGPGRLAAIQNEDRERGQRTIRTTVESIAKFYGFNPPGGTGGGK
jgi:hypothetical protein